MMGPRFALSSAGSESEQLCCPQQKGFRTLRIIGSKEGHEKYLFFFRILSAWMPTPPH